MTYALVVREEIGRMGEMEMILLFGRDDLDIGV